MIRYYSVPKETFVTNGTIVEPLNVTENGTYAPPAGTAYSPVVVNVEGGGGSSDFSTARVTIVNTTTTDVVIYMAVQLDVEEEDYSALMYEAYVVEGETLTVTAVLYKGAVVAYLNRAEDFNVSVSGSAEYDRPNFDITGDCTISIS